MKTNLPINQISEGQRSTLQLAVEPDTEIVQDHFGPQTCLKACDVMGSFPSQAQRIQQLVVDGFNDLSQSRQPATQWFGPVFPLAGLMRWSDDLYLIAL